MKRTYWIVAALAVALAGGLYWFWGGRGGDVVAVDLVEAFRGAEKRSTLNATVAFSMDPQTVGGITRPAIYMHPTSRVTYRGVLIPEGAHLRGWLAIKEEAWDKGTDGVLFRVGVSSGGEYVEVVTRAVDPYHRPEDRGWQPIDADLARWAGQPVDLIFNTNASLPGVAPNDLYDFAIVGAPAIVVVPRP